MATNRCKISWQSDQEISIAGMVDEYADFSALASCTKKSLVVDLSGVSRINSSGVRSWIQTILRYQIDLVLKFCSPVVVEQFSMIPEFIGKNGYVESFFGLFVCEDCLLDEKVLFTVGIDVMPGQLHPPDNIHKLCSACGQEMEFDHNSECYFSFLKTMKSLQQKAS